MEGVKVGCGLQYIKRALKTNDWSSTECRLFKEIRHELTENNNIILKGSQIILPKPLRLLIKVILVLLKQLVFLKQRFFGQTFIKTSQTFSALV